MERIFLATGPQDRRGRLAFWSGARLVTRTEIANAWFFRPAPYADTAERLLRGRGQWERWEVLIAASPKRLEGAA